MERACLPTCFSSSTNPLRVALFCTNSPEIISIIVAAQLVGITVIPLNPSYKKYEISEYLLKSNATHVIISDDVEPEKFNDIPNVTTISELLNQESGLFEATDDPEQAGVIVFFSSGTTGPPKLFEYTQQQLTAQIDQIRAVQEDPTQFSPAQNDVCYGVLPFFHAGGLVTVLSMLFSGVTLIINERWSEQEFLAVCQNYRVSVLFLVPPVLHFLAVHPLVSSFDLTALRTIFVGAAASLPEDFGLVARRFPGLENLIQLYGTTECGVLLCSTGRGIATGKSVGKPYPLAEIKIEPKSNEILVKSATAVEEVWMETGDLGSFISDELVIQGRSKEMIKVRGWQVNPTELEEVIRSVGSSVQDCAVFQHPESGQLIAKVIGEPASREQVFQVVKDNLASYKHLDNVIFVTELPRNPSGKLVRHLL
uniref:Uncharacterized protein n=1 Tax=Caenorhabditis japonica TaxID=281687 RepID=A0A8R1DTZ5_CAEJA